MLTINPKKFKHIQNKTIPSPLRPKFRNSGETNIYFLSKKKLSLEKKKKIINTFKITTLVLLLAIAAYFLSK
tara:strand:- start:257 stop:472 length:216 start_codon:yes stop_codon:yes gene_type:complete